METTYLDAITQAMAEEMARDERVFLMGEDVGAYGGAFKTSAGLIERFGPELAPAAPSVPGPTVWTEKSATVPGVPVMRSMMSAVSCAMPASRHGSYSTDRTR